MTSHKLPQFSTSLVVVGIATIGINFSLLATTAPAFRDVTTDAGIQLTEESVFSISWTDFNSDGRPDLWISPHGYRSPDEPKGAKLPSLYLNQGGGTFTNIISQVWPLGITGDTHGSAWADFDNDNDPDLFVLTGAFGGNGENPKFFFVNNFVNNKRHLHERAASLGLNYTLARGRSPFWFDSNQDGLLDVLALTAIRPDRLAPNALFQQTATGFRNANAIVGLQNDNMNTNFAQLANLAGDANLELVIQTNAKYPQRVYNITTLPFQDITPAFPAYSSVSDAVIADFNNDLHSDIFLSRNRLIRHSTIFQANQLAALAALVADRGEVGVSFKTNGNVLFDFFVSPVSEGPSEITPSKIFIGSQGRNPGKLGFTLSPNDPSVRGIKPHIPGSAGADGLYIGYNSVNQTWQALLSSQNNKEINLVIETTQPLSAMTRIGFGSLNLLRYDLPDVLLQYDNSTRKYVNRTPESGLGNPILGQAAVAGDFDNDMDVDLYVRRGYNIFNLPSVLYENRGNGTFVEVPNAGGAAGSILGFHLMQFTNVITGSRVAVADYDVDGFLDLFASSTAYPGTQKTYLGSPHQLFRNLGNTNHWLEIDLKGVVSNRDGIGARVLLTAGGVTQLREQGGGMHFYSQNHQRLHFGLGGNTQVSRIEIRWPSGIVQTVNNVDADQVLQVVEPS